MRTIVAAGGLVTNEANELMMIYRRGKWDLPKGKLDEGENIEQCALREVAEETGASNLVLDKLIGKTYHQYFDKWVNEEVIKETWWYAMKVTNQQTLVPQLEEDIEQIDWVKLTEINTYLKNSYDSIREIVEKYLD